ncbi:cytochrome c1 [Pseudomonadota bacterium]|jgi:ubiquinol-cytochrome c reductase cytochrome c1 subunit
MKKIAKVLFFLILLLPLSSFTVSAAAGAGVEHSGANIADTPSLQRGAKWYVNYCMGCHSLDYMRYNRLAEDLQLSEDMVMLNLVFSNAKFADTMNIAMDPEQAKAWFGKTPPDLSLVGRSRGADWLYSYLLGFYQDENGEWNNTLLPNVSMPHVLWALQGIQTPVYRQETSADGFTHEVIDHFELTTPGSQSSQEFEETARDIAAFLEYVGEPAKLKRKGVGVWVILFLVMFTFVAYLLKAEYWRDVH